MIRAYSQRLLPPYSGTVQIAESVRARAQSFDGLNWEIHYLSGNEQVKDHQFRMQGYGLDRGYYVVASLKNRELKTFSLPSSVEPDRVLESIHELAEFLSNAQVPFPAGDIFEYWLLDRVNDSPLALIYSCCDESLIDTYPGKIEWTALPHSKMRVENTEDEQAHGKPPVNHRFQRLISNQAGSKPRAAWFKRDKNPSDDFPNLLVREDWVEQAHHDLCQRYIMRKAPRLLMLQGLSNTDRSRLEIGAKENVFEVEDYYHLYPAVCDEQLMAAIRVEAQLRRASPETFETTKKKKSTSFAPLDKDMRIIEN